MDLEKREVKNFSYVMGCLHRLNLVVDELATIYKKREGKEYHFISQYTFKIYHMGLIYIFICEYCKLLEGLDERKLEHWGSLAKLNEKIMKVHPTYTNYDLVKSKINALYQSNFHLKNIKALRDSTFAHLDKKGEPFKVTAFEDDEFYIAKQHVKEMIEILNLCGEVYRTHYHIETGNDSTERFINKYAQFYETRAERVNRVLRK